MSVELQRALGAVKDAVYAENSRGGEARGVVAEIAHYLGVDLGDEPIGGDIWSPQNMCRVAVAAKKMRVVAAEMLGRISELERQNESLRDQILDLQGVCPWKN